MKFYITGCSEKTKKTIRKFLSETPDIEIFCNDLARFSLIDSLIYGYNPWDYLEETKLNMKHQKFSPLLKNEISN